MTNKSLSTNTVNKLIETLCPVFGSKSSDVPLYDAQKHAYLVNQYVSPKGNRALTYVAVCDKMAVEFVIGHHYCMEYINSLRLFVPDGFSFKVAQTYKWDLKTHYSNDELHEKVAEALSEFIKQNAGGVSVEERELAAAVEAIVAGLFGMTTDYLSGNGRKVLEAYCKEVKLCKDFTGSDVYTYDDED